MANSNITINLGTQTPIASDIVSGTQYQTIKLDMGTAGVSNPFSGTIPSLSSVGTLGSITDIGMVHAGSFQVTSGTTQLNASPTNHIFTFAALGTAGAGTAFGTIAGTSSSGTQYCVTDWSIIVVSGTPTVALSFGTNGGAMPIGTGVIDIGAFPPGGGLAKTTLQPINSGTNAQIVYCISAGSAYFKTSYFTVATSI